MHNARDGRTNRDRWSQRSLHDLINNYNRPPTSEKGLAITVSHRRRRWWKLYSYIKYMSVYVYCTLIHRISTVSAYLSTVAVLTCRKCVLDSLNFHDRYHKHKIPVMWLCWYAQLFCIVLQNLGYVRTIRFVCNGSRTRSPPRMRLWRPLTRENNKRTNNAQRHLPPSELRKKMAWKIRCAQYAQYSRFEARSRVISKGLVNPD